MLSVLINSDVGQDPSLSERISGLLSRDARFGGTCSLLSAVRAGLELEATSE